MVIKVSAATEVRALVKTLAANEGAAREAAVARLMVIGPRAIPHLVSAYRATKDRGIRVALLRTMEPIEDQRGAIVAREAIREGGDVAVAAAFVLRGLLDSRLATTGPDALDALVSTALDTGLERRVRLAAVQALEKVPNGIADKLAKAISDERPTEMDAVWKDALDGHLPDDPGLVREALNTRGAHAPLTELRVLVEKIRARETAASGPPTREWQALRGAVHQALALRGSRVALYDLRESLESATAQLPPSFISAVHALGDRSCLEAIAAAYNQSTPGEDRWRHLLATAFRTIASREKISKRHAVMKRIGARWPGAGRDLKIGR
jgi:hypothetical protein